MVENRNFSQKLNLWSKIEIAKNYNKKLVKNGHKGELFLEKIHYVNSEYIRL